MIRAFLICLLASTTTLIESETAVRQSPASVQSACADGDSSAAADALAAQFDRHQFIFIGSTHGELKIEEFLTCLISRPAFSRRATDIVTEWAGSGHQDLLDRYAMALDQIPDSTVASIWFDTDAPTLWTTLPQVRRFLQTFRETNRALPPARRIRLIGGNEGIDWTKVRTVDDLAPYPYKTNLIPHLLIEHLAKSPGNRTLVIYGDCHVHYRGNNFIGELESALGKDKLFVVGRINELTAADRPFLAATGSPDKAFFVTSDGFPAGLDGPGSLRVCTGESSPRLADYMDAFVYLGPDKDRSLLGSIRLTDGQQRELDRRASIKSDAQRTMQARIQGRSRWFSAHPNDLPPRPVLSAGGWH